MGYMLALLQVVVVLNPSLEKLLRKERVATVPAPEIARRQVQDQSILSFIFCIVNFQICRDFKRKSRSRSRDRARPRDRDRKSNFKFDSPPKEMKAQQEIEKQENRSLELLTHLMPGLENRSIGIILHK